MQLRPCAVAGVRSAILRPLVDEYPEEKYELVAPVRLRLVFHVRDGDTLAIAEHNELAAPNGPAVDGEALDEFDAVIFDLDRTLVELDVDWSAVKRDLRSLLGEHLSDSIDEATDTDLAAVARTNGLYESYLELLAEYETNGIPTANPLDPLEVVPDLNCPVGVCTKNAVSAAEGVLERFGVREAVDSLVGRETVNETKPHPKPLRHCLTALDIEPGNAVFIGDQPADCGAASRAGTSYFHPDRLVFQ